MVTYATTDKGKYKGQDVSGRYRWTDVFVHRGGTWQIVTGQGTRIQPPANKARGATVESARRYASRPYLRMLDVQVKVRESASEG